MTSKNLKDKTFFFFIPFAFLFFSFVLGFLFGMLTKSSIAATLLSDVVAAIVGLLYIWRYFKKDTVSQEKRLDIRHFSAFVFSFLLLWFICQQISSWFFVNFVDDAFTAYSASAGKSPYLYMFLAIGVAPVFEEVMFRGILFLSHQRAFGSIFACFSSAAAFALFHGTLVHLPSTFLFGLFLAVVYLYTGRLMLCMGLHVAFNGLTLFTGDLMVPDFLLTTPFVVPMYVITLVALSTFLFVYVFRQKTAEWKERIS